MSWIEANGLAIRYARCGQDGPILVLLHEMGGCLESWEPVMELLQTHAQLIVYDARGAGMSEKPVADFTIDDLADDLAGLLDGLGVTAPVTLVGCAVGAATAIRFASRWPARVAALIVLAPAVGIAPEKRAETLALIEAVEREGLRERVMARFDLSYPERFFAGRDDRLQLRARLLQQDNRAYARTYRMLYALDLAADLPRLVAPVLVLAGSADRTRPPGQVEQVARSIPDACFEVIDSGHAMHVLTPALLAEKIKKCLKNFALDPYAGAPVG
jgi:3-oxoadipate enol-lactonase